MTQQAAPGPSPSFPTAQPAQPSTDQFTTAANAQGQAATANVNQQTVANRANQVNPFGSASWSQDPTTGQWTQNIQLAGAQNDALTAQQNLQAGRSEAASGLLGQATSNLSSPIDTSKFAGLYSFGAPGQINQQAQDAVSGQLQPIIDQQSKALDSQLANQGITPGSEAYQNAHDQLARDTNNLRLQGVQAGFAQGNAENAQNINYGNYQQGQNAYQFQQAQALRNQPLTDINNLTSGQQVTTPQFGQYAQAGVAAAPNYLGAAQSQYNQTLDQQNAQAAQQSSLYSGLFGLGSSFLNSNTGQAAIGAAGNYLGGLFGLGG